MSTVQHPSTATPTANATATDSRLADPVFAERYRAMSARDARFDGQFITGVHSTGIYCRPSLPGRDAQAGNVDLLPHAAAAHEAGLRACKRCLPDAVPGSPEWNVRDDLAARAMRLIADGDGGAGGRPRSRTAARLHDAPPHARADRRARRGPARPRPRAPRADRATAAQPAPTCRDRRRLRGRVQQRPPVQRDDGRGVPDDPGRDPRARRGRSPTATHRGRAAVALSLRLPARAPSTARRLSPSSAHGRSPGWRRRGRSRMPATRVHLRLPHGPATVRLTLPARRGPCGAVRRGPRRCGRPRAAGRPRAPPARPGCGRGGDRRRPRDRPRSRAQRGRDARPARSRRRGCRRRSSSAH